MASCLDTAPAFPQLDEDVSPELALVDPELARRLRDRDVARALERVATRPVVVEPLGSFLRAAPVPPPLPPPVVSAPEQPSRLRLAPAAASEPPSRHIARAALGEVDRHEPPTARRRVPGRRSRLAAAALAVAVLVGGAFQVVSMRTEEATSTAGFVAPEDVLVDPSPLPQPPVAPSAPSAPTPSAQQERTTPAPSPGAPAAKPAAGRGPTSKGAPAIKPIRLAWAPNVGAAAYRLELFRGDRRILAARTTRAAFTLRSSWRYQGKVNQLQPGVYRWYVWPISGSGKQALRAIVQSRLRVG